MEFDKVSFAVPGGGTVLHDVSATFPAGRITAVVGGTGMGKSTLVRLLLQLEAPSRGSIRIDGRDSRDYDPRSIRAHIGYVEQEVRLFSATIRENILYGRPGAGEDDLAWAIDMSDCAEFLARFPDGLDTRIGADGVELSRGQKQRVCLARAMIRRPRILVLDETTASLDPESERTVIRALTQAGEGRTTVYVSHRLGSLDFADRVVVMERWAGDRGRQCSRNGSPRRSGMASAISRPMRIPSRIEWTAGAVLVGAAACSLLRAGGSGPRRRGPGDPALRDGDRAGMVPGGSRAPCRAGVSGCWATPASSSPPRGNRRVLVGEVRTVGARFRRSAEGVVAAVDFESDRPAAEAYSHPLEEGPASFFLATRPASPLLLALLDKVNPAR